MRLRTLNFFCLIFLLLCGSGLLAQPIISYTPTSNIYTAGTAITTITPGNSGGAVAGISYGTQLNFATVTDPYSVATDASGNVFTINGTSGALYKFNSAGTGGTINTTTLSSPAGIAVDGLGNVWVTDFVGGSDVVYKFSSTGTLLATITGFSSPYGIGVDASNNVYIANSGTNSIIKIAVGTTTKTNYITGMASAPYGIAFDPSGNMFISENTANAIVKVAAGTTTVSAFFSTGLSGPRHLAADNAGNIYVSDYGNGSIKRLTATAALNTLVTGLTNPRGVAVDPAGNLYYGNYTSTNRVQKKVPTGGWFIDGDLPLGLSFNSTTGAISGTPTTPTASTVYTITAYNASGSDNTTYTITVKPATPTASGGGTGCSLTLTASGGSPAGGTYNWYNVSTGGTAVATGTTYAASPGTYYVSYTYNTVESSRSTGTTVTAGTSPILATAPTGSGLYLSYPFNGNANDASTAGNNGTVQNSATLTADRYGAANSAYTFNGSTQYISTATASAAPGPQNFSISVWFKTSSAGGMLVGYGSSQTGASAMYDRHIYMTNAGQIYYGIYSGSVQTLSTATSYADGNWHHVVATTSTTAGSYLFVDGAVVAADITMTTSQNFGANGYWRVGYDNLAAWTNAPTNPYFSGSLDDVAVYNTALTASQVYTLYGAGSPPTCVGSSLLLQANTVTGATYSWSGPGGYTSSSQNPTVTASASAANAGTYTLTVTNATGCVTTTTVTAVVNTLPVTTFTATTPVTTSSNSTVTYTGTYLATSTYSWNFGGGTIVSGSGVGPYTINWSTTGTKTITLTVTNAAGCSDVSTQSVVVSLGNYGNYGFKKTVTLNTTTLGITSNLTNFPALLSVQDNNLIISNTCTDKVYTPNGPNYDFAFVDATGTELYYQIESYNQTTGTLLVWVQIPTLTFATNNAITFYYGSPSPTVTHNTTFFQNTWASDYKAVFHFNESSYTGSVTDGTAGAHTGATAGMTSADLVTGKIGTAYSFNGSSKKITSNAVNITGTFTISAWVQATTVGVDQKILTNQAAAGSSTGGYKLGIYSNNLAETESGTAINRGSTPLPSAIAANAWHYVQGVFNGTTLSTYIDGAKYENLSTTTAPTSTTPLYIGVGEGGSQYYFNGIIDEARVSNVAKSSDWLKAEYVNQGNPVSFTSSGATTVISASAAAVPGALTYTWKGTVSTDPTNANNWNNTTAGTTNQLPAFDGTATLIIPAGLSNYPLLTGPVSLFGLTIANGASFNLNGQTLSVACNIYNSSGGQILYGTNNMSSITWNGTLANQTYTGTNTSNTASLGSMTINNTAGGTITISGGPVDIYNSLTITQGNLAVGASPAALTLKSTATQTAYVAAIPSGSAITGTVKVERYITGGAGYRGYRILSSPVSVGTDSYGNKIYSLDYIFNTNYVSGTSFPTSANSKVGNPCFYLYRENMAPLYNSFIGSNNRGIKSISSSPTYTIDGDAGNFNIPIGNGVLYFFRGGTGTTLPFTSTSTPAASTVTSSGTLNQGNIQVVNWYTPSSPNLGWTTVAGTPTTPAGNSAVKGFNLVGNPYASPIDWNGYYNSTPSLITIPSTAVNPTIYQLKPGTNTYGTYNGFTKAPSLNGGSNIIASGQGFFVTTSSASATLTFTEAAKSTTQPSGFTYLASAYDAKKPYGQYMILNIAKDADNKTEILIGFNPGSTPKYSEMEDDHYLSGSTPQSMWITSNDGIKLVSKWLPLPKEQLADTANLTVTASASGQYTLNRSEFKDIPNLYDVWLIDNYKKDSLDIKHNDKYIFDIDLKDSASYGSSRFKVVIRQDPALRVHLLDFTGTKTINGAQLNWTTENEENYTNFTVERSNDGGKTFVAVGGYPSSNEGTYSLLDKNPPIATDWYRLKLEDLNGTITYSKPIQLMYSNLSNNLLGNAVSVYPNPATSVINVSITPSPLQLQNAAGNNSFAITITGSNGVVVKKAVSSQTEWQAALGNLLPGSYVVQVINKQNQTVVGKSKFVKL